MHCEVTLQDEAATERLGARLGRVLAARDVALFEGELGAGKTALIRSIARSVGVPVDIPITSPTFALVNELPGAIPIVHADLVRLERLEDLDDIGLLERIGSEALVLVEWGDRFRSALQPVALTVRLTVTGPTSRRAELEGDERIVGVAIARCE